MKLFILYIILFTVLTSPICADMPAKNYVNFYTLAANQSSLNGKSIALKGWIYFAKYEDHEITYLFPSNESMKYFSIQDAVILKIDDNKIESYKSENDRKFVRVAGKYNLNEEINLFGYINNVTIIHKRLLPKE